MKEIDIFYAIKETLAEADEESISDIASSVCLETVQYDINYETFF